jgi:hypothetical protein
VRRETRRRRRRGATPGGAPRRSAFEEEGSPAPRGSPPSIRCRAAKVATAGPGLVQCHGDQDGGGERMPRRRGSSVWTAEERVCIRWWLSSEPPFSHKNGIWRLDLGADPKLGAPVEVLLELHFFVWAPIFSYGGLCRDPTGVALMLEPNFHSSCHMFKLLVYQQEMMSV